MGGSANMRAATRVNAEQQRINDIKNCCREDGRELLTPLAIVALFGISASAIRVAGKKGCAPRT